MPRQPNTVNALQASQMAGKSERTIRLWIASGKLQAVKVDGEWAIDTRELARVAGGRGRSLPARLPATLPEVPPEVESLSARIEILERELASVKVRLRALETLRVSTVAPVVVSSPRRPMTPPAASPVVPVKPDPLARTYHTRAASEVPSDWVTVRRFAELHGRDGGEEVRRAKMGKFMSTSTDTSTRAGYTGHWLTLEQQAGLIYNWQIRGMRYTRCPECPHEPLDTPALPEELPEELPEGRERDASATRPLTAIEKPSLDK